jgi:uracil-DNA glycosylase
VQKGTAQPPSLVNIFKELNADLGLEIPPKNMGELTSWAKNGVLLLNNVLTVREGQPNSHKSKGWELFTDAVISALNNKTEPVVFILWGANAREKAKIINNPIHLKLSCGNLNREGAAKPCYNFFEERNHYEIQ